MEIYRKNKAVNATRATKLITQSNIHVQKLTNKQGGRKAKIQKELSMDIEEPEVHGN